jgi:hypothetical protein
VFYVFCLKEYLFSKCKDILHFVYRTVILYDCETWSLALKEEHMLKVFENSRPIKTVVFKSGE